MSGNYDSDDLFYAETFRELKTKIKKSYTVMALLFTIGIITIIVSIYFSVVSENIGTAFAMIVVGIILDMIAYMLSRKHKNLLFFMKHCHEYSNKNEKLLDLLSKIDQVSEEKRNVVYQEIIYKQIELKDDFINRFRDSKASGDL